MATEVELPDGTVVEFPDGTPPDVIKTAMRRHVAANRSWTDVPGEAVRNVPASALKFGQSLAHPFLHPIDTAQAIGNIGYGVGSKIAGKLGATQDPEKKAKNEASADAVGQFFKERYGSLDGIKETLATDPVGALGDAALVLTGGGAAAARGPGIVARAGQAAQKVGQAIDPLNMASAAIRGVAQVPAHVLGVTTGTGARPIQEAFAAGKAGNQAFPDHMRGLRPIDDVVDMAEAGTAKLVQDRGAAYTSGMQSAKANQALLNYTPIFKAVDDARDAVFYQGIAKDAEAAKVVSDIQKKIGEFIAIGPAGKTVAGYDALKQAIGEIRQATKPGSLAEKAAGGVYNAVKSEIVKQAPDYAKTMKDYANASETINEIRRALSVNRNAMTDTTTRKLQSVMRNNVNTNYGQRVNLAEEIGRSQPDLMPALAGQALNSWTPRGLALGVAGAHGMLNAATNPVSLAALPLASPRAVGEAAYATGQGARIAKDIGTAVGGGTLLDLLLGGYRVGSAARPVTNGMLMQERP